MDVRPTDASIERTVWDGVDTDTAATYFEFGAKVTKADGTSLGDSDTALIWFRR